MGQHAESGFQKGKNRQMRYRVLSVVLSLGMLLSLAGCAESAETKKQAEKEKEVHIPIIFTVNPQNGTKNNQELVEQFNEEYKGTYQMDVEWVMETEEEYRKNLKRQNVTDTMPAVITDLRLLPSFYEMVIADGRVMDLAPYMEADSEWKEMVEPAVLESFQEEDGSLYLAPLSTAIFSCSGMFWNEELFAKAGIEKFPETWEEFWECCDTLKSCGITPLGLHTEGTAWASMLIATAQLASTEEGAAFMKELFPETYQNASGQTMAETLKKLFSYTTDEAYHNDFDVAFDKFFSGEVAMLPNGYWMIEQIPEEWQDKVRFSAFPENKLISSPETFGWSVVDSYSDEVKEGAVEFVKYRTRYNKEEKEQLLSMGGGSVKALNDYIAVYSGEPQIVPNYQTKWNSIFQEETLGESLPELVKGRMSVEEFLQAADESIKRYQAER